MVSKEFVQHVEPLLFPVKLYELAHSKEIQSIKWSPDGTAVQLDVGKIAKECFETKIFNVKDYRHVFRQLSYYGFQRTEKKNQVCEFFHPLFNAHRLDLVLKLKRSGKKNRNLDIASLAPFIERRTSSRLQSVIKYNPNNPSTSKSAETESDSESSDDYQSTVTVKRRRRKVNRKRRVKKLRTAADENNISETIPNHLVTTRQNTAVNGNENPSSIVEKKSVNRLKDERDFRNENKRTRRKKKRGRFHKKCPSRHATRDKNTLPKNEEAPSNTVPKYKDTPFNTIPKNEDTPVNTVPKNGEISFGAPASASHFSIENDVEHTSKENLKIFPIKINIKGLTNDSSSYSTSVNDNNKTTCSDSVNNKQSSMCNGRLRCIQSINAGKSDIYGTSSSSTRKCKKLDHVKLKNVSNTLRDKTYQSLDTTAVNDSKGVNPRCDENGGFKFRIVPNGSSKNFVLGKSYKWNTVQKETDNPLKAASTTETISSTPQKFSSFYEFSTYNHNQKTNSRTDEAQVVPDQNDAVSTQSKMPLRSSRCHAGRRKRICTNSNTSVDSMSNIVNNSSNHIDDNNSFYRNSHQSLPKKKPGGMVTSFYSDSSNKLKSIQSYNIAALEEQIPAIRIKPIIQSNNIAELEEHISGLEIIDEDSDTSKDVSGVNEIFSVEARNGDFTSDSEDHPSPTEVNAVTSSDDFSSSDGFSPISPASGNRPNSSSSTQRDCSETGQANEESHNFDHATRPNCTLPPDDVEVEINISPYQKEKLVQRLYLEFKMGKISSWDLLESQNPLIKFVAYDVLTLDVEIARGNEMNFDNNYISYDGSKFPRW